MTLGAHGIWSYDERLTYYRELAAAPVSDEDAETLDRVQWLKSYQPREVLDIGCKDGFATRWMANEPWLKRLVGVDPGIASIEAARDMVKGRFATDRVEYHCCDYRQYEASGFDAVICFELLEHFHQGEGEDLLRYVHSALKPGGRAFLNTPNVFGAWGRNNPDEDHLYLYSWSELIGTLARVLGVKDAEFLNKTNAAPYLSATWVKS